MSGFIATGTAEAFTLTNDGFWPDLDADHLRASLRMDGTVSNARLEVAAVNAILSVNRELKPLKAQHQADGYATLADVPGAQLQGVSGWVHLYRRAVYCTAGAELAMLDGLTKGAWNLRIRDDGSQRQVCLRTGREFIQLRHREPGCSRFVVRDGADEVVVQYTCRGNGYGRTSIRREGSSLVQIRSQGIQSGTPFSFSAEARHVGSC